MENFQKQLEDKFQRLNGLQLKKNKFSLINGVQPSDKIIDKGKLDFNKMDLNFFRKIKLFTGAIYRMDIFDQENFRIMYAVSDDTRFFKNTSTMRRSWLHHPYDSEINGRNCNNLNLYQIEYFTIEVIGFRSTVSLLRLLLGHPDFYSNIYRKVQFDG
ncbi:hypothetical protein BLA29_005235 [Euroglyphus maynei]|uniref:Uncharacterized protein n=1 Tax=Euroglyphus maynei TaxID=6958 RepID=A0A1Y3AWF1_EURMA|nr:hypothetical protein BLA29_005235 [Euroglyphus maynei]